MIDGSEKRKCQLAFELHNSHVREKRSKGSLILLFRIESFTFFSTGYFFLYKECVVSSKDINLLLE